MISEIQVPHDPLLMTYSTVGGDWLSGEDRGGVVERWVLASVTALVAQDFQWESRHSDSELGLIDRTPERASMRSEPKGEKGKEMMTRHDKNAGRLEREAEDSKSCIAERTGLDGDETWRRRSCRGVDGMCEAKRSNVVCRSTDASCCCSSGTEAKWRRGRAWAGEGGEEEEEVGSGLDHRPKVFSSGQNKVKTSPARRCLHSARPLCHCVLGGKPVSRPGRGPPSLWLGQRACRKMRLM